MPLARVSQFVSPPSDTPHDPDCCCIDCVDETTARRQQAADDELASGDFIPSPQQESIFDWFAHGDGNLIVRARAGTGKTTTILRGIQYAPEDNILVCAFNKRIQEELASRLECDKARAQTLNSVGYRTLLRAGLSPAWTRMPDQSNGLKPWDRENWLATQVTGGMPYGAKRLVAKLVTKAREIHPLVHTYDKPQATLCGLAADFDILPDPGSFLPLPEIANATLRAMDIAAEREPTESGIDFADQLYLPLRKQLLRPEYDLVVVDEAQDMTAAQLLMARAVCHPYGRFVIVGDDRQAIYGFRGADSNSLDRLKKELDAEELPLSKTYRCPKRVVALVQTMVPDMQVDPSAPEGVVDTIARLDDIVATAEPGDFVLSRKNAPIARVAMALLRAQKRAKIQGRDIGLGLKALIRDLAKGDAANSLPAFHKRLSTWEDKQCDRLVAMKREDRCDAIRDQANTLRALSTDATGVPALTARIDYLFTDNGTGSVVCSTVHKAKGLEANRVFVLKSTFFLPVSCECGHRHPLSPCKRCPCKAHVPNLGKQREEQNLYYVAVTRAKKHLTICEEIL